ncbi:hypothetical protein AAFC00_000336 [Neodothiora populina]|uniref:BHLH domain-containing protein n=1 Tax=Neodothiora populina TaxID=2781224 RepID=A0ABR3PCJ4_9PEZI
MSQASGEQSLQWADVEQMDVMGSMQDMDFSSFLDIGELDLTAFSPTAHEQEQQQQQRQFSVENNAGQTPQPSNARVFDPSDMIHDFAAESFDLSLNLAQHDLSANMSSDRTGQGVHDSLAGHVDQQADAPNSWSHHEQQQHQPSPYHAANVYHTPQHVPPTPNSYEMHGNPGRYLQQQMDPQTRSFLEQHYQLKNDNAMSFTPLVSPAVTPQDSQFQPIPQYTVPGAYFSPLTSPALQAQNGSHQPSQMQSYQAHSNTAPSSVATSPIDLNADIDMADNGASFTDMPRKSTRKMQPPRSTGPQARVRQSPIVKAQSKRRATHLSSVIPIKEMDSVLREAQQSQPLSAGLLRNAQFVDSSGTESISPESLSESLMGPPPRPLSAKQSPALLPQIRSAPASAMVNGKAGAPATPASLMSLRPSQKLKPKPNGSTSASHTPQETPQSHDDSIMLDDFVLPPAANTQPPAPLMDRIVKSGPCVSADATPRLSARKTPKLAPGSTPLSALSMGSTNASPSIMASSTPLMTPARKGETKPVAKIGKKRGSIGGPLISPAIRPKISPSIKPLLPEGAKLNESQQALLLASKSNYTHILEGTLLPGVTYPESLSSGLTSKRTSHKIAEQGRRNRINDALKEMQALLPKKAKSANGSSDKTDDDNAMEDEADGGDNDKTAAGPKTASAESKNASSKAATVESAIDYIKLLQQERLRHDELLKQKDAEMALLRKELQNARLGASAGIENKTETPAASTAVATSPETPTTADTSDKPSEETKVVVDATTPS